MTRVATALYIYSRDVSARSGSRIRLMAASKPADRSTVNRSLQITGRRHISYFAAAVSLQAARAGRQFGRVIVKCVIQHH